MSERRSQSKTHGRQPVLLKALVVAWLTVAQWPAPVAAAAAPKPAAGSVAQRGQFSAADLGRATAIGGAASFVGALVLFQLSQAGLTRLDGRLGSRDDEGRVTGIAYDKAQDELALINRQRLAGAILGTVGLAAMGFACGVLVATSPPAVGWQHTPMVAPSADGLQAGWLVRW